MKISEIEKGIEEARKQIELDDEKLLAWARKNLDEKDEVQEYLDNAYDRQKDDEATEEVL